MDLAGLAAGEEPDDAVEVCLLGGHGAAVEGAILGGGGHHGDADVLDQLADLLYAFGSGKVFLFGHRKSSLGLDAGPGPPSRGVGRWDVVHVESNERPETPALIEVE